MPIPLECDCGRSLKVKDELAGRKIRCPECRASLKVPAPESEFEEPEPDQAQIMQGAPPAKPRKKRDDDDDGYGVSEKPRSKRKRVDDDEDDDDEEDDRPRRKRKSGGRERPRSSYSGIHISGGIITGTLMMLGAMLWFVLGLCLADRIFFYPPILFVVGIITFVKGCMGHED